MAAKFANLARSTITGAITNVGTSLTVVSGDGAKFPTTSATDYFYATLVDGANIPEIVTVTTRTTDTFTITRGQGGTTARAFGAGATITNFVTAEALNGKVDLAANNVFTKAQVVTPVAVASAASITLDATASNTFVITVDTAMTINAPTGPTDGQVITIVLRQGTTGGTATWNTVFKWQGGGAPTLSVGSATTDVVSAVYIAAYSSWFASIARSYA